jgi:hypothetical protein
MTRHWTIWLLPPVLALHNLEEAVFFPRYVPRVLDRLPAGVRAWIGPVSLREMGVALGLATVIPLGFSLWAAARPASRIALWLVLAMWATPLLNVAWHVAAALVLFGGHGSVAGPGGPYSLLRWPSIRLPRRQRDASPAHAADGPGLPGVPPRAGLPWSAAEYRLVRADG